MIAPNDGVGGGTLRQQSFKFYTSLDLVDLAATGYWWCKGCHHILTEGVDTESRPMNICPRCKSPKVEFQKPIPKDAPLPPVKHGKCNQPY